MSRLCATGALVTLALALLCGAAMALGAATYAQPAFAAELSACDLPCWNGITPGYTTPHEAHERLTARGYRPAGQSPSGELVYSAPGAAGLCDAWLGIGVTVVSNIWLRDCSADIRLGDFALQAGQPEGMLVGGREGNWLWWRGNTIAANVDDWSNPRRKLISLLIITPSLGFNLQVQPWHGFVRAGLYCRFEPNTRYYC